MVDVLTPSPHGIIKYIDKILMFNFVLNGGGIIGISIDLCWSWWSVKLILKYGFLRSVIIGGSHHPCPKYSVIIRVERNLISGLGFNCVPFLCGIHFSDGFCVCEMIMEIDVYRSSVVLCDFVNLIGAIYLVTTNIYYFRDKLTVDQLSS